GFLLRRALKQMEFDAFVARWAPYPVQDWTHRHSPTRLVTGVVWWLVVLVGFAVGLSAFDAALTTGLALSIMAVLPDLFAAALLAALGFLLARFLARSVLINAVNMNLRHAQLLSLGVKWLVLVLASTMALEHLGLGGRIVELAFGILFGGIVLTLALAIGLGSRDFVSRALERQAKEDERPIEPLQHM
ncbi:MAG: hypothetical protein AB7I50_24845, partial [Vicinamibacterales bacterium]